MSGSDGEARCLTNPERRYIRGIINGWKRAAGGSYHEHFIRALMKFALDSNEILVLMERADQSKKPAGDA